MPRLKDVHLPIRTAYYQALSGLVVIESFGQEITVPVYDRLTAQAGFPYIAISEQQTVRTGTVACPEYDSETLLQIITGFQISQGEREQHDLIAGKVYELLSDPLPAQPGFDIDLCELVSDLSGPLDFTETHVIYRRLIRLKNKVYET